MQTAATGSSPGGGAPPPYIGWSPGPPPPDIDAKPRGPMERRDSMLERTDQYTRYMYNDETSMVGALQRPTRDGEGRDHGTLHKKKSSLFSI